MDIIFSYNNGEMEKVIPVPPSAIDIEMSQGNSDFESFSGPIRLLGNRGLTKMSWSSIFPNRPLRFIRPGASAVAKEYIDFFEAAWKRQIPLRVVIIYKTQKINIPCTVDSLSWKIDRAGDVAYSISLTEFVFVQWKDRKDIDVWLS